MITSEEADSAILILMKDNMMYVQYTPNMEKDYLLQVLAGATVHLKDSLYPEENMEGQIIH